MFLVIVLSVEVAYVGLTVRFQLDGSVDGGVLRFKDDEDLRFVEWFESAIQKFKLKEASIQS